MPWAQCNMSMIRLPPCYSVGALVAVVRRDGDCACSRYARRMRAEFNYGPDKTAAMAMLGSPAPDPEQLGCSVVSSYRLLGCLVDDQLTFVPLLSECACRSRAVFLELFHAAETGGFSVAVLAQQTMLRIELGIMYVLLFW